MLFISHSFSYSSLSFQFPYLHLLHLAALINIILTLYIQWWKLLCWLNSLTFWSENFFRHAEQRCCTYWIRLTRNARSGKFSSSHCYLDRWPLHEIDEIVYEYDRKQFNRLVYIALSRVIFNELCNIIHVCRSRYIL